MDGHRTPGRFAIVVLAAALGAGCAGTDWGEELDATQAIEQSGDLAEAERRYAEAAAALDRGADPGGAAAPELLRALTGQARVKAARGDIAGALPLFRRALDLQERSLEPGSPELAVAYFRVGSAYQSAGETGEARALFEQALAVGVAAHGEQALELCEALNSLGLLDLFEGRLDDAEGHFRRSLAIMQAQLLAGHPNVISAHANLAETLRQRGEVAAAEEQFRRAIEAAQRNALPARSAAARSNLAGMLRDAGRGEAAEAEYLAAIAELQPLAERYPVELASALNNLGLTYRQQQRLGEAETYYVRAIEVLEPLGATPDLASSLFNLARLYERQSRFDEAAPPCARSVALFEATEGPGSPSLATALEGCAAVLRALGREAEADAAVERARAIRE